MHVLADYAVNWTMMVKQRPVFQHARKLIHPEHFHFRVVWYVRESWYTRLDGGWGAMLYVLCGTVRHRVLETKSAYTVGF
jgi:hypothetical protein